MATSQTSVHVNVGEGSEFHLVYSRIEDSKKPYLVLKISNAVDVFVKGDSKELSEFCRKISNLFLEKSKRIKFDPDNNFKKEKIKIDI